MSQGPRKHRARSYAPRTQSREGVRSVVVSGAALVAVLLGAGSAGYAAASTADAVGLSGLSALTDLQSLADLGDPRETAAEDAGDSGDAPSRSSRRAGVGSGEGSPATAAPVVAPLMAAAPEPTPTPSTSTSADAPTSAAPSPEAPAPAQPPPAAPPAADPSTSSPQPAPALAVAAAPAPGAALASGVNAERVAAGLPALATSDCAQGFAQRWAVRLAETGDFEHQDLGPVLSDCSASKAAENIAWTTGDPVGMVGQWMDSSGHRANILDESLTHVGSAAVQADNGRWYGVQVFVRL